MQLLLLLEHEMLATVSLQLWPTNLAERWKSRQKAKAALHCFSKKKGPLHCADKWTCPSFPCQRTKKVCSIPILSRKMALEIHRDQVKRLSHLYSTYSMPSSLCL
jgi:hypothetical protein